MTRNENLFETFWGNIDKRLDQACMTMATLAKESGIVYGTLANWKYQKRLPDASSLVAIANALNTSVDSLLGNEKRTISVNKWAKYNEAMEHISLKELKTIRVILGMDPEETTEDWKQRVV